MARQSLFALFAAGLLILNPQTSQLDARVKSKRSRKVAYWGGGGWLGLIGSATEWMTCHEV